MLPTICTCSSVFFSSSLPFALKLECVVPDIQEEANRQWWHGLLKNLILVLNILENYLTPYNNDRYVTCLFFLWLGFFFLLHCICLEVRTSVVQFQFWLVLILGGTGYPNCQILEKNTRIGTGSKLKLEPKPELGIRLWARIRRETRISPKTCFIQDSVLHFLKNI